MTHPADRSPERTGEPPERRGGRAGAPDAWGIVPGYEDAFGNWTDVDPAVRDALVVAMGGDPDAAGPPESDAVRVIRTGDTPLVPDATAVVLESGETRPIIDGRLPDDLPPGYHDLRRHGTDQHQRLIVSPGQARLPDASITWGWAVQVASLWSDASWGIGDLRDLRAVAAWSADVGADTVLINPLYAVTPVTPRGTSPYYPTSRRFLDPIHLAIEEVPGGQDIDGLTAPRQQARAGTADGLIDRDRVYGAKLAALERIWTGSPTAGDEPPFRTMIAERGRSLWAFAVYCTLVEHHGTGWRAWPPALAHPDNLEVAAFAEEHADRVRFHQWLQWLCEQQMDRAGQPIALLGDLPIGADPDGFDAWEWQDVLADGVTVGAPPDALGPHGQNWMLPAFIPWRLRDAGYEPFIQLLRAAMRHVAGLRIDHVLGLFRLFWIPPGHDAADGTYVRMPARELLDILALESHRNRTFVVGEDLGTVEAGVRDELDARDILRYQVWWFEQDTLDTWSPKALASVSTHDLPTVAGVWSGADVRELRAIGQQPDDDWYAGLRRRIAAAAGVASDAPVEDAVVRLHGHIARAPDRIVVAQLDDALTVPHRINVPGTDARQRPANWSRPLPVRVDELDEHATVRRVITAMTNGRQDRVPPGS